MCVLWPEDSKRMRNSLKLNSGNYEEINVFLKNKELDLSHLRLILQNEIKHYLEKNSKINELTKRSAKDGVKKSVTIVKDFNARIPRQEKLFTKNTFALETFYQYKMQTELNKLQKETVSLQLKLKAENILKSLCENIQKLDEWNDSIKAEKMSRKTRQKLAEKTGVFDTRDYDLIDIKIMDNDSYELHFRGDQSFLSTTCTVVHADPRGVLVITDKSQYLVDPDRLRAQTIRLDSKDVILYHEHVSACSLMVQEENGNYRSFGSNSLSCSHKVKHIYYLILILNICFL